VAAAIVAVLFVGGLMPQTWGRAPAQSFKVMPGDGFREIVDRLQSAHLIRSAFSLKMYGVVFGSAHVLKPGLYDIAPSMSGPRILDVIVAGDRQEVRVVVPEGSSVYDTDRILAAADVLASGSLVAYAETHDIEGRLFPDTYNFFAGSPVEEVVGRFLDNFESKARPLLKKDESRTKENIILASIVEREVRSYEDQRIVAGILKKRLSVRMPLQVDATICYIKKLRAEDSISMGKQPFLIF